MHGFWSEHIVDSYGGDLAVAFREGQSNSIRVIDL